MRLLVLSLLALGAAQGYSVNYRSLLQGYAPARGEFAVQQGLLRYQDSTGAERLIPIGYDTFQQKGEKEDQLLQLRAWCEQRYNAMRIELERLRAEGKQPPAKMLAQYEQLDQFINSKAFEPIPVPGLTPEVQRARDEHLRMWNEARLQVLQAEAEQAGLPQSAEVRTSQEYIQAQPKPLLKLPLPLPQPANPIQNKLLIKPNPYLPSEPPKPVQETAEVLRAREEHLKRFHEALQAQLTTDRDQPSESVQQQPQQPLQATAEFIKKIATPTFEPQQVPQPVEETPEVKRAREEHLKQYNEALLQAQSQTPIETPIQSSPQEPIPAPIQAPIQDPIPAPIQAPTQASIQSPPLPFIQSPPQAPIQSQPQVPPQAPLQALALPQALTQPLAEPLAPLPTAAPKTYKSEPAAPSAILSETEPIAPLPTATIKSSIPSAFTAGQKAYDQKIHQLQKDKIKAEDKVADIEDRLSYEERERERERFRDLELRRKEQRQAELEQEQEAQRLTEERNLLEAEQLALVLQEQKRLQDDLQQQDAQRLQAEQKFSFVIGNKAADPSSSGGSSFKLAPSKPQTPVQATPLQPQAIAQQQQVQNGFFLRIQSGQPAGEGYVLAENTQNPFLLRYVQQPQALALTQPLAQPLALPLAQFKVIPGHSKAKPSPIATPTSGYIPPPNPNGFSELEKATREHFKAHEIALEQLRLANLKDASSIPTPCQH